MKTNEPIPTLALDDLLHMAASAIEDLLEHTDPNTSYYSGAWADVPGKLRAAAMLQSGNSPVIPDGLIAAVNRLLDSDGSRGCYSAIQCGDAHDEIERLLAAAPHDTPALNSVQSVVTVPGKWIPVSERMPKDEQEVLTINKMGHRFVSFFDKHSGLFFDRLDAPAACCIEHVLVTHWMPLPAGPQGVKGE